MADLEQPKRKRGRPRKYPEGTRANYSTRLTKQTHAALKAAARAAGRSISEEIEYRIQRSFDNDARLNDLRTVLDEAKHTVVWNPAWGRKRAA
jgi:hypothetical protein